MDSDLLGEDQSYKDRMENECLDPKNAKRVVAPFLRTLRKKKSLPAEFVQEKFQQFYLQRKPSEVLQKLSAFFEDPLRITTLMNETVQILKGITKARGGFAYIVDHEEQEIKLIPKYIHGTRRDEVKYKIEPHTTLAAYVAWSKEYVSLDDILGDPRFPDGIPGTTVAAKSVLAVPILSSPEGDCIGVIELFKTFEEPHFKQVDLHVAAAVTGWMGVAIHQNGERLQLMKQMEIHNYLLGLSELFFSGAISFNKTIADFIIFAKATVHAEKGSFYLMNKIVPPNSEEDIFADAFEEGILHIDQEPIIFKKKNRKRYMMGCPGIPGYVAREGQLINIVDAYSDKRFPPSSDQLHFRTRSLIALPVTCSEGIMAVLQLSNKRGSHFTREDEIMLKIFTDYAALACQFEHLDFTHHKSNLKLYVNHTLLHHHILPPYDELSALKLTPILSETQMPPGFFTYDWHVSGFEDECPKYVVYMLYTSNLINQSYFNLGNLTSFVLTVRKAYLNAEYHNFEHAFTCLHCMFLFLSNNGSVFDQIEMLALLIASYCHDVDHNGFTNSFLQLTNNPLTELYEDNAQEHHHVDVCMTILQATELLIHFPREDFDTLREEIEKAILSTELSFFLKHKVAIIDALNTDMFDITDRKYRNVFKGMMMLAADFSGQCKSFDIAKKVSESLYKEFFMQGDHERNMGLEPCSNMDRRKVDNIPDNHICFMSLICVPIMDIVVRVLPNTERLLVLCKEVLNRWKEVIMLRGIEIWKPEDSIFKERKRGRTGTSLFSSMRSTSSDPKS